MNFLHMIPVWFLMAQAKLHDFCTDEEGDVNIVSIVVLIGVAVLMAIIFKDSISKLLKSLFDTIEQNATNVVSK